MRPKVRGLTRGRRLAALLFVLVLAVLAVAPSAAFALVSDPRTVSGRVYAPDGTTPVQGVSVKVLDESGMTVTGPVNTDVNGSYTMTFQASRATSVLVSFDPSASNDANSTMYIAQWWDGGADFYSAQSIDVSLGNAPGIDATLEQGAKLAGSVSDVDGPLSAADVSIYLTSDPWTPFTTLSCPGSWTAYVPAGEYKITAAGTPPMVGAWYSAGTDWSSAATVTVAVGDTRTALDIVTPLGGSISGIVTDVDDVVQADCTVDVFDKDGFRFGTVTTGPGGTYSIDGLPTGEYVVLFNPATQDVVPQYWNNAPLDGPYDFVTVALGADTPGISPKLTTGGTLTGIVADRNGTPLAGIPVLVSGLDPDWWWGLPPTAVTDAEGRYTFTNIAWDTYCVSPDPTAYNADNDRSLYFPGWSPSVKVHGATVTLDVRLLEGATVEGIVTGPAGEPLEGVWVSPVDLDSGGGPMGASTDADGRYTLRALGPAQRWAMVFDARDYNDTNGASLISEWWSGHKWSRDADTFATLGAMRRTLDFQMREGGGVSGTIRRSATGMGVSTSVCLYTPDGRFHEAASAGSNGVYQFSAIAPGDYLVRAGEDASWANDTPFRNVAPRYYDGAAEASDATTITVKAGEDTPGIDIDLPNGGTLSGEVTGDSGAPLGNVEVSVYRPDGTLVDVVTTAPDGTYATDPWLDSVAYIVRFDPSGHNAASATSYATRYSGGSTNFAGASPVTAAAEADTAGVNAALDQSAGVISGTLTPHSPLFTLYNVPFVTVWERGGDGMRVAARTTADAMGNYSIGGLPAGDYVLSIDEAGDDRVVHSIPTQYVGSTGAPTDPYIPVENAELAVTVTVIAGEIETVDYEYVLGAQGHLQTMDTDGLVLGLVPFTIERLIPGRGWTDISRDVTWFSMGADESPTPATDSGGWCSLWNLLPGEYRFNFGKYGYRTATFDGNGLTSRIELRSAGLAAASASGLVVGEFAVVGEFDLAQVLVPATPVSSFFVGGVPAVDPSAWTTVTPAACTISADLVGTTTHFRVDAGSWETTTAFAMDVSAEGTTTIEYLAVSGLGAREATNTMRIRIDTSAPTVGFDTADGTYTGSKTVGFTGTDAVSGVAGYEYRIDSGTVLSGASVVLAPRGTAYTLEARAIDRAGHVSVWSSRTITVQGDVVVPPAKTSTSISIRTSATSVRMPKPFQLSGELNPGKYLDPCVVWVKKPGSGRWSYSSLRLAYKANTDGSSTWWYRYTPKLRGTYTFKVSFAGDATRLGCTSPNTVAVRVR